MNSKNSMNSLNSLTSNVELKVYNLLGKQIAVLVGENLNPGSYEVEFNGTNIPSGIYFYTLTADHTKKHREWYS